MSRLLAVSAALALGTPFVATAADITRVASSFEDDDPFGMFVDVGLEHSELRSTILRDVYAGAAKQRQLLPELAYTQLDTQLHIDVAVGISRDVEFSFGMPVVLHNEIWNIAAGHNERTVAADGLFTPPTHANRVGLGNAHFGLAWAIFNQQKDDTKPTWVARFEYEAPTAPALDPYQDTISGSWTPVGDRVHKYTLSTALSRRIGVAEPYFKMYYTIPVQGPGAYTNCQHQDPEVLPGYASCGGTDWPRSESGIHSPTLVGVMVGSEFEVFKSTHQKFVLDVRFLNNYVGEGRYYNELSGALHKLLTSSDYLQVGGQLGLTGQVYDFLKIRGSAMFYYNTDHALTDESPDNNNPNYDPRVDGVSQRFYASQSKAFRLDVTATLSF